MATRSGTWRPWGLMTAVLLLLAVEFGLARNPRVWSWRPRSDIGVVDALERAVVAPARAPAVVVLGGSRIRDAVSPRLLEQLLGLPEGTVLNLGLTGGSDLDSWWLYRRNFTKLATAQLVVLGTEPWDAFRSSPTPPALRFATLQDRLEAFGPEHRLALIVGWFWRTYDAQKPLRQYVWGELRGERPDPLMFSPDGRIDWHRDTLSSTVASTRVDHLATLFSGAERERLYGAEQVIAAARRTGSAVLVVQVPFRDGYITPLLDEHPEIFQTQAEHLARLGVPLRLLYHADELQLGDGDFHDYGHLAPSGTRAYTEYLAAVIKELRLMAGPSITSRTP